MKLIGFRENSNKKTTKKQSIRSLRSKNMSLWKCFEWNYISNSLIHRQDMFYKIFDLRTFHVFCSFVECYRKKNWKPSKNSFRNCKIVWKKIWTWIYFHQYWGKYFTNTFTHSTSAKPSRCNCNDIFSCSFDVL